jgi:hypothetical protein
MKDCSKIKDKTHSYCVRELNECKSRVTEIQKWIEKEKDIITVMVKMEHGDANVEYARLAMLRDEAKFLVGKIKNLKAQIKDLQKTNSNSAQYHYRMYSMVLRQLNPMQKGIQSLHAVVEYGEMVKSGNIDATVKKAYNKWAKEDKTMIVLDGGVSDDLIEATWFLSDNNIPFTVFHEPDLYGVITSICFLADERVWDTKNYPSYDEFIPQHIVGHNFSTPLVPTEKEWRDYLFKDVDPEPIMKLRELIFSKKLSM